MTLGKLGVVRTNPPRVAREIATAFAPYGVATVHEAQGRKGLLHSYMRPVWPRARAIGTAVTLSIAPAGNWIIHVAGEESRGGDMLAGGPTPPPAAAYLCEVLGFSAPRRGAGGGGAGGGCC